MRVAYLHGLEAPHKTVKNEYLSDSENPISEDEAEVDALEWVDFNIAGGYLGIRTPMIIST